MTSINVHHLVHILVVVVLFLLCFKTWSIGAEDANTVVVRCIDKEREALLLFKRSFINKSNRLSSWGNEESKRDCCRWRGVYCNNHTGHVVYLNLSSTHDYDSHVAGTINPSLLELRNLNYLDLSYNDFGGIPIPKFIGSFAKLVHLDLSKANFSGAIPHEYGNLSKLHYLNLGRNDMMYVKNLEWVSGLSSLTYLDLSSVDLRRANGWVDIINSLPSLSNLYLSGCQLSQVMSPSISTFINSSTSITNLDLSYNNLAFSTCHWLFNLSSSLVHLKFSENLFKGPMPNEFGYLNSLTYLDLDQNQLVGVLPKSFGSLSKLEFLSLSNNHLSGSLLDFRKYPSLKRLYLSYNQFNGPLPDFLGCPSLTVLHLSSNQFTGPLPDFLGCPSLTLLYLSSNQFTGPLPDFRECPSMTSLSLSYNQFTGPLPYFRGCPSLKNLYLSSNQFTGHLPDYLGCPSLSILDISNNSIKGVISERNLSNLSNLTVLRLSFNSLTFNLSSQWVPPFQLDELRLRSCKLGSRFPNWIRTQKKLSRLDLSSNGISDSIPTWFWDLSPGLVDLNLSSNNIPGILPNLKSIFYFQQYPGIDLSSNSLEGPIPRFLSKVSSLNLSRNKFSGTLSFLQVTTAGFFSLIDVSHNLLSGGIPDCWMHFKSLKVLNLASNNFSGGIPSSFGFLFQLESLNLYNNSLSGKLPASLRNCRTLSFLNVGENNLSGFIPAWIGENLSNLYVLGMRSNKFYGIIPLQLCYLTALRLLDISVNNISGVVPECFSNFTAMIRKESPSEIIDHLYNMGYSQGILYGGLVYIDNALVAMKGGELDYGRNLRFLKSIDLSSNNLSGEFPRMITALLELVSFNISNNDIYGNIPPRIGNLTSLESLDLSNNRISGEIPTSMSSITFLSYLDLSNNNLSGRIPSGTQLQGFNVSMYSGNDELCGPPLPQKCRGDESSQDPSISGGNEKFEEGTYVFDRGFYIAFALGFCTTFWGLCGAVLLNPRWRRAYFLYLSNLKDSIYVTVTASITKFRRMF